MNKSFVVEDDGVINNFILAYLKVEKNIMRYSLLAALFLCICLNLKAQDDNLNEAKKYLDKASEMIDSLQYDSAINYSKKILKIYKKKDTIRFSANNKLAEAFLRLNKLDSSIYYSDKNLTNKSFANTSIYATALQIRGKIYDYQGNYKEAVKYHENALNIWLPIIGEEHKKTITSRILLARNYVIFNQNKKALQFYQKALDSRIKMTGEDDYLVGVIYSGISDIHSKHGEYLKAVTYSKKELKIMKLLRGEASLSVGGSYINLGTDYVNIGNYQVAIECFKKAEKIYKNATGNTAFTLGGIYHNFGKVYYNQNEFLKSISYFQKAITIYEKLLGPQHYYMGDVYHALGVVFSDYGDLDQALSYFEKSEQIRLRTLGKNHPRMANIFISKGKIYYKQEDYEKAIIHIKEGLNIFQEGLDKAYHDVVYGYNLLGRIYRSQGDLDKAVESHLQALKYSNEQAQNGDPYGIEAYNELAKDYLKLEDENKMKSYLNKIPSLINYHVIKPDEFNHVKNKEALVTYLMTKRDYYQFKLKESNSFTYSDSIKYVDQRLLKFHDFWDSELSTSEARESKMKTTIPIYEKSITHLLERNQSQELIEAFKISEETKSRLLTESFRETEARHFGKVPDSLVKQEYELDVAITYYDKKFYEQQNGSTILKDSLVTVYRNKLFDLKQKRDELRLLFRNQYPNYYHLKYQDNIVSIEALQQLLNPEQTLVSYFVGDENIFIFLVTATDYSVKQIKKDFPLKNLVDQFRESIYNYDQEIDQYLRVSHKLYAKLVKPIEAELTETLLIIPDDILNYIPFEALLTEEVNHVKNYKGLPYMLRKHQISYNYSATLYQQLLEEKESEAPNDLLAFAPEFKGNTATYQTSLARRKGFADLKFNIPEVKRINELISGTVFIGNEATEENFLKYSKDFKIIHLATHGKSNDKLGDYSFVAFSKVNDSVVDANRLYVRELYDLDLNADMVVLSACETGLGELKRGEGVIGMARAFTYAGAKSTVTSLWSVDDAQTKKLMELFYENIKEGMPKDKALHLAKLSYLDQEYDAAPYFWASFIPAGNMEPVLLDKGFQLWWLIVAITLIGIIVLIYKRKQ